MKEIHLEPWESISETVKGWLPLIEQRLYPMMPEDPEVGKFYRLYPEDCISANHTSYHGSVRIGEEKEKLLVYFNGGVSWDEYMAAHPNGLFNVGQKDRFYFNECEWLGDGVLENGIASRAEGKPFRNWSVINLPYSTGDFHCSIRDAALVSLQNYIDGQGMIYTREGGERLEKRLFELFLHMQETMPGSACFFFTAHSGNPAADAEELTQHGILEDVSAHRIRTEGKTVLEWLVSAMNGNAETVGLSLFAR